MESTEETELKPLLVEKRNSDSEPKEKKLRMFLCCAVVYLGSLTTGSMLGLSSPLIPDIENSKSKNTPHLTFMEASWFGSLLNIGGITGGLVAGYIMQGIGRKLTTTISAVPFVVGLLFIMFADRLWMLYVGRVISGLSVGTSLLLIPVYIGEISTANLRGMLGSANQLCISVGVLIIYELGSVLPWRWLTFAAAILPILLFIFSFFIVETPRYLMLKHHSEKARLVLQKLRGPEADIESEYEELKNNLTSEVKSATWSEILREKSLRTPTLISIGVMYFQKFSGIPFVMFYAKPVFMIAGFKNGSSSLNYALLAVAGFQVLFTLLSSLIVDKTGRKVLLLISGIFMSLSLTVLGLYFHILSEDKVPINLSAAHPTNFTNHQTISNMSQSTMKLKYMPVVSLVGFMTAYSIGFGPIAWLLMGELIPVRARGISAGFSTAFNLLLVFIVTSTFNTMMKSLTPEGTFWLFAGNNALSVLYIALFLPETKGKSLEEIEAMFKDKDTDD